MDHYFCSPNANQCREEPCCKSHEGRSVGKQMYKTRSSKKILELSDTNFVMQLQLQEIK